MIDLLAYRHHMRWLKMCEDTLAIDRKSRKTDFRAHLREFDVSGWNGKMGSEWQEERHRVNPCRFCKVCVKTHHAPDAFYGNVTDKTAWNKLACPREIPYSCGMLPDQCNYPIMNMNWRIPGPLFPLAVDYVNSANVEFSLIALQNVATLGNRIARASGDVRLASRRVQEIEMRKSEPHVRSTAALLSNHPTLRGRISQLHTIGALPFSRGQHPDNPRPSGLPYDESKTLELAKKLRKVARERRTSTRHNIPCGGE